MVSDEEIYNRLELSNQDQKQFIIPNQDKLDFKDLDEMIRWTKYARRIETIKGHGYSYISEFIYDQYYNHNKPLANIGKIIDYTPPRVGTIMDCIGFPRRPQGGNIRHLELKDPEVQNKIMSLRGKINQRDAAKLCKCSQSYISRLWAKP